MAKRPVFVPSAEGDVLVQELDVEFRWHAGFAPIQKSRNIKALHDAARSKGLLNLLEISTKSEERLGVSLSAFNLKVAIDSGELIPVECAYQGSKVFTDGGPFVDLFREKPRIARRDDRLTTSGRLIAFRFGHTDWELEPKTAFYDWLYLRALRDVDDLPEELLKCDGFTDIEFNPKKSMSCQARSCALFVSLTKRGLLREAVDEPTTLIALLGGSPPQQPSLL